MLYCFPESLDSSVPYESDQATNASRAKQKTERKIMDQVLQLLDTGLQVMLVALVALTPGMVFWSVMLGISLLVRSLRRRSPYRRQQPGSELTLTPLG